MSLLQTPNWIGFGRRSKNPTSITLSKLSVPSPFEPISISSEKVRNISSLFVAGFGLHGLDRKDLDSILRYAKVDIVGYTHRFRQAVSMVTFPLSGDARPGPGDSGAPSYIVKDGLAQLVGVYTSAEGAIGRGSAIIIGWHRDWLREQMAKHLIDEEEI